MQSIKHSYRILLSVTLVAFVLNACATRPPTPDAELESFNLTRDLLGKTTGVGNFNAIDGTDRDFTAYLNGSWDGKVMTLVEDFEFSDGTQERKTWVFTQLPNGEFSGVREDVVGTARGYQDGSAFRLEYIMAIPNDDGSPGRKLRFRDVLVKHSNGVIQNDATVGFWGLRVGSVSLMIDRQQ
ncbi:MAG: DUF3833 family protein [Granulosicoccus sp.]